MGDIILTDASGNPKPRPPAPRNAQLSTKIVFWHNPRTDHILQGAPERFEPIYGYQRVVCNSAHEAEVWSKRLNEQDKRMAEMNDYEREQREAPMRADIRREIQQRLAKLHADSRNPSLNARMLQRALDELDKAEAKGKNIRESYLHAEAFEAGKGD